MTPNLLSNRIRLYVFCDIRRILFPWITMHTKTQFTRTLVSWVALSGWLLLVNPSNLPVILLVVPFVLVYLALYQSLMLISAAWSLSNRTSPGPTAGSQRAKLLSTFLSLLLVLGSLGQLVFRDVVTLFLLVIVGYFYLAWVKKGTKDN